MFIITLLTTHAHTILYIMCVIRQWVSLLFSRGSNELKNLQFYMPRSSEPRETLVEDRTKCHADHIGQGFDRQTTAAAAILKAVHCSQK